MKFEIRISKSSTNSNLQNQKHVLNLVFWSFGIVSNFGFHALSFLRVLRFHDHLDLSFHLMREPNLHAMLTGGFDRLGKRDPMTGEGDAVFGERRLDIARGDRPEAMTLFVHL